MKELKLIDVTILAITLLAYFPLNRVANAGGIVDESLIAVNYGNYIGEIVPTPKQVSYSDEYLTLWSGKSKQPKVCVIIDKKASQQEMIGAAELSARVGYLALGSKTSQGKSKLALPLFNNLSKVENYDAAIVIGARSSSNSINKIAAQCGVSFPEKLKEEGYAVRVGRSKARRFILCLGADARGAYYSTQSLLQLMSLKDRDVIMRLAEVTDWPSFHIRCTQLDGSIPKREVFQNGMKWLTKFKLNTFGCGENYVRPPNWRELPEQEIESLKFGCSLAKKMGTIDVMLQVHPHRGRPRDVKYNIRISNPKDIETLIDICEIALDAGASYIMLRSDDYHPLAKEDQSRFGDKANAHIYLINQLYSKLKAKHPNFTLLFCPPYYQGYNLKNKERSEYLHRVGGAIPKDVLVIWTGPVTRSLEIKPDDVNAFADAVGSWPFLWDNTIYAHRSKYGYNTRHPGYLFDTFATKYPKNYYNQCPGITYNWGIGSELRKVANINIADYLWNPAGYNPEASLRKALAIVGGISLVDTLIDFRDAYYAIKDTYDAGAGMDIEVFGNLQDATKRLSGSFQKIKAECRNRKLVEELSHSLSRSKAIFNKIERSISGLLEAKKSCLVQFDFSQADWQTEVNGKWAVKKKKGTFAVAFPWRTSSFAGAYGRVSKMVSVPKSPTGKYYIVFSVSDDYRASGTPPKAWPGYLFKQVLLNEKVVWEDDVEGDESVNQQLVQIVDLTERLRGVENVKLTLAGLDKRGVGNMGAKIRFSNVMLCSGPFELEQ